MLRSRFFPTDIQAVSSGIMEETRVSGENQLSLASELTNILRKLVLIEAIWLGKKLIHVDLSWNIDLDKEFGF